MHNLLELISNQLIHTITRLLDAECGTIFLNDEDKGELYAWTKNGTDVDKIRFPNNLGIAGSVFTSGETINISEAYSDPNFNEDIDHLTGYCTRSILCMPLTDIPGKRIGVIQVVNKIDGKFTAEDELILRGAFLEIMNFLS